MGVNMVKDKLLILSLSACLILCVNVIAYAADYVEATPEKYQVTLKKVELSNDGGSTWVTVGSGDINFDIASKNAGEVAGTYISNVNVPAGTYNKMRATVSRSFVIKTDSTGVVQQTGEQFTNSGQTLYTRSGTYTTTGGGSTTDSNSRDEQTVVCPTTNLPSGITYDSTNDVFYDTRDVNFTITEKTTNGNILIKFDVNNSLRLYPDATFYPMPPTISVTIT